MRMATGCDKVAYITASDAENAARKYNAKKMEKHFRSYACNICIWWHLTTHPFKQWDK